MSALVHENSVKIDVDEVRKSSEFIKENLIGHFVSWDAFRFCLELYSRALFKPVPIISPSLDFGVEDGFSTYFRHRDKPVINYGAELPSGANIESFGLNTSLHFDHFEQMIGMDLCQIPFPDNSFATIFCSHAMHLGQDLPRIFSEIMRVLAPGGTCTYACDLDEWLKYKTLVQWITPLVPTFTPHAKEHHLKLLEAANAVDVQYRTFFPAALKTVLIGFCNNMPAATRGQLASEIGQDGEIDKLVEIMDDVFCTLIETELSKPQGPEDAFHIFVSFKKPGSLPANLPVPVPVCALCHGAVAKAEISTTVCQSCGEQYSVHAGVPMMMRAVHPAYANDSAREEATSLSKAADQALTALLPRLQSGPFYLVYDGLTPVPGLKAPNILGAFMQHNKIAIAGVVALNVSSELNWKGHPIVQLQDLPKDCQCILFTADAAQADRWVVKMHVQGVTGKLFGLYWAPRQEPVLRIINI